MKELKSCHDFIQRINIEKPHNVHDSVVGSNTQSLSFEDKLRGTEISIVASSFVGIALCLYKVNL